MSQPPAATGARALGAEDCRTCGACCAYSAEWPRFSLEDEDALARIPSAHADHDNGRMLCAGNRCTALKGTVGISATCVIYDARPIVCRDCLPGDEACLIARKHYEL